MKYNIIFPLLLLSQISFGQFLYQGKILDGNTYQPIENVAIKLENTSSGVATDSKGEFKIYVTKVPAAFVINHIGYKEERILIEQEITKEEIIFLFEKINTLNEVTVIPEDQAISLSEPERYSILDFEVIENQIYRLEYYGAFKKLRLSLTDLSGNIESSLKLKNIKQVNGLHKSCNNNIYVLSNTNAYAIKEDNKNLLIDSKIQIDTFKRFILPCKLNNNGQLYYLNKTHNGLVSRITRYDLKSQQLDALRTISNDEQLKGYRNDLWVINRGQRTMNGHVRSRKENEIVRDIQEIGDFLFMTFYKPEFPIFISSKKEKVILLNHIEKKIEVYARDTLLKEIDIQYVLDRKWLKTVKTDAVTEKIFGLFKLQKGIGIKEINLETGATTLVGIIDTAIRNYEQIAINNSVVYYLKKNLLNGSMKELFRYSI